MQARGALMIEHRVIERMLSVIQTILAKIQLRHEADPLIVDMVVDFIQVYADQTHHGKEEDILFRDLNNKPLSDEDRRVMNELIADHVFGRQVTKEIVEAKNRYRNGDEAGLADIVVGLKKTIEFYPGHIQKEDRVFFPAVRAYFSDKEDQGMLIKFWEFDRKMIHEKYKAVVEKLEG